MPTQFFTDGNDSFTVTLAGDYNLVFLDGNDTLTVNGGTFTTGVMGEGADVITLRSGDALIYGDGGNDRFEIYGSGFEARGGADHDVFNIRGGNNLILRGDGGDDTFTFFAGSLSVLLRGGVGNDVINGRNQIISGNIYGDSGNDTFIGFRNAGGTVPNLRGGLGDDIYLAHPTAPANFIENAGEGIDSVQVPGGRNYTLPANIENFIAGAFAGAIAGAVTLNGNGLNNVIQGHTNPETINGLGGNDSLHGGDGVDTLNGGAGNDQLDGEGGVDTLAGGDGNDTYFEDGTGDVIVEARGEGTDIIHVTAGGSTLPANVENGVIDSEFGGSLTGNSMANILTGGNGADFLQGESGNDRLYGGAGEDFMLAGNGSDILDGGAGADSMSGGVGDDRYYIDNLDDEVGENPGEGTDTIFLNAPDQEFNVSFTMADNVERLVVGAVHPHVIRGNALANTIIGSNGTDQINGAEGDDVINGNGGSDSLFGFDGMDTVIGGNGNDGIFGDGNGTISYGGDTLTGGAGADFFVYLTVEDSAPFILRVDQITDFETGIDQLDLRADADANAVGSQDWTIVDAPTGAAGQLWIDSSGAGSGDYVVFGDDDGDGLADLMIQVHALSTFSASDIVL